MSWDFNALFSPRSVAVIGASGRPHTIGNRIIQNLLDVGFTGRIHPVNPGTRKILGLETYAEIQDVPGPVDVAHVVLKNTLVPEVVAECARKGVKVCIINTAGFRELGPEGGILEKKIIEIVRETGIRIIGPNCQGIINTDPNVSAYCNFTFTRQPPGGVSIFSQSGGVGEFINNRLCELGEGIRLYASTGNACDIQCEEILKFWGDDPETRVIVCHLEGIRDTERFRRMVKPVSLKKPIIGWLAGSSVAGARAVISHTGGGEGTGPGYREVLEDCGIQLFSDTDALCHAARAFARLPIPGGNRTGIITNTGGAGIISSDELTAGTCRVAVLSDRTLGILRETLLPEAVIANPVDTLPTANADHFDAVLSAMQDDPGIDSILFCLITPFFADCEAIARAVTARASGAEKPVICVVMTDKKIWKPTLNIFRDAGLPVYDFPETGARVLNALTRYGLYLKNQGEGKNSRQKQKQCF